jgi:ankyrin repeat protein
MNIFGVDMSFFKKLRAFFSLSHFYKVISNTYEVIACFILRRTNLNKVDKNGDTALHRALRVFVFYERVNRLLKRVNRLLKCGADVHAVNKNGDTPLHMVTGALGACEILALLIEHGADVNAIDKTGCTPLYIAVLRSERRFFSFHREELTLLIGHGADVNTANNNGFTPLFVAIEKGNPELVALLLKNGADVNAIHKNGWFTPLFSAVEQGTPEIVALLLKHGADVHAVDQNEFTPLFNAVHKGNSEIVALLIKHGADVNAVGKLSRLTALCFAGLWLRERPGEKELSIFRILIIATLLDNIDAEKSYAFDRKQEILLADCRAEIEALSQVIFNNKLSGTTLSLLDFCKEKDENKLAQISQNEEVKKILENLDIKEKYPYLNEKIQAQFQKGLARNQALFTACNSVFTFNTHRQLNEDCWKEILKNLPEEDLKNVTRVASLFFKQSPSNDSSNFSTAIKRNLMEAQLKQDKEAMEKQRLKDKEAMEEQRVKDKEAMKAQMKELRELINLYKPQQAASSSVESDADMPKSSNNVE